MARYRKIDIRMWGDREVLRLSRPQPNGQSLWVYLLAGPATGIIPGAYRLREGGLADELGWTVEGFREAFAEVSGEAFRHGFRHGAEKPLAKADWAAGMVWVPKAIKHNPPQSIHVVSSWKVAWDELPECDLKLEAYQGLRAYLEGMSKGFVKAFDEAIPKPSWKPSRKALAIQEQEQDQEQDQEGGDARAHAIPVPLLRPVRGAGSTAPSTPHPPTQKAHKSSPPEGAAGQSTAVASANGGSQKLTSRTGESELGGPSERPLRLWAIWQELIGGDPDECPSNQSANWIATALRKLDKRGGTDAESMWRRMAEAYIAERRERGKKLDLGFLALNEFDMWAERVSRATLQGSARPEHEPYFSEVAK
jgi:hypothetical protein